MAGLLPGESSNHGASESGTSRNSQDRPEEGAGWYFTRKEIEENSPSRLDGIDLKKETYLRKSYCTFLQDLGMKLKVPQITIATAIVFCHRFFIRQSHTRNDRRTVATVCMFLAGKVEETPRPLKDVILISYEIINKKDPPAAHRIKQKEVYEQQKELILVAEKVVLSTLAYDFNVHHPYKPLVEAIKKFQVAQNALAQVAWNFVNDGLRTSLCLQFKPHHIAAGAIFLAAKFLKVKLPSDGEKVWWQEFDVTPRQLEEVSNQMLELYEQNKVPQAQGNEVEAGGGQAHSGTSKTPPVNQEHPTKKPSSRTGVEHAHTDNHKAAIKTTQIQSIDNDSAEGDSGIKDHNANIENKDVQHADETSPKESAREILNKSRPVAERINGKEQERTGEGREVIDAGSGKDDDMPRKSSSGLVGRNLDAKEAPVSQSPKDAMKMIDRDKVKAALEKRKKARGEMTRKKDVMDEDDLIERELEDGIELAAEDEKLKRERRQNWSKMENTSRAKSHDGEIDDVNHEEGGPSRAGLEVVDNAEEGEMLEDALIVTNSRKRKAGSPPERVSSEGKKRHEHIPIRNSHDDDSIEDGQRAGRTGYGDRDHRRHSQENHS
ncbi:CYCT1-5 [Linum perenne]